MANYPNGQPRLPHLAKGYCRCSGTEETYVAILTEGTSVKVVLGGNFEGTINGLAISGRGHIDMVYLAGSNQWVLDNDAFATCPSVIQGTDLNFQPTVHSCGSVSILTNGQVERSSGLWVKMKRHCIDAKGRLAPFTVTIRDETLPQCDDGVPLGLTGWFSNPQANPANFNTPGEDLCNSTADVQAWCADVANMPTGLSSDPCNNPTDIALCVSVISAAVPGGCSGG